MTHKICLLMPAVGRFATRGAGAATGLGGSVGVSSISQIRNLSLNATHFLPVHCKTLACYKNTKLLQAGKDPPAPKVLLLGQHKVITVNPPRPKASSVLNIE